MKTEPRFYLAILRGHLSQDFVTIDEGIGKDTREQYDGVRMASDSMPYCSPKTRTAKTHLVVLEKGVCYGYPATKVLLRPITGRRHQLRIHCHVLGHTIVGDYTYSNRKDVFPYRMFLHAFRLKMENKLEPLDITTSDPFLPTDHRNHWIPTEMLLSVEDAFYELSSKD
jgi:23S rRNA-/tRNA-specific pseudouridylate synthase